MTVWLVRIWTHKNADEKAHTLSRRSKNVKKRTKTYEKRILCKFTFIFFYQNSPQMKLFLQKNAKFSSAGGSSPRPPCPRRLGAFPPNPQPPATGGLASRPPKQPSPHCEFLSTRLGHSQENPKPRVLNPLSR